MSPPPRMRRKPTFKVFKYFSSFVPFHSQPQSDDDPGFTRGLQATSVEKPKQTPASNKTSVSPSPSSPPYPRAGKTPGLKITQSDTFVLQGQVAKQFVEGQRICDKSVVLLSIHQRGAPAWAFEGRCSDKNTQWLPGNGFRQGYWFG